LQLTMQDHVQLEITHGIIILTSVLKAIQKKSTGLLVLVKILLLHHRLLLLELLELLCLRLSLLRRRLLLHKSILQHMPNNKKQPEAFHRHRLHPHQHQMGWGGFAHVLQTTGATRQALFSHRGGFS